MITYPQGVYNSTLRHMNLGTILDELGLDALSPGGPDDPDAGPQEPLDDERSEDDGESDDETPADETDDSSSGGLFGNSEDSSGELSDEIADLEHELDGVRNTVEQNSASIDGLESEQELVGERLDRIEEHNATLLGVYDHLTESVNPFTGDWEGEIEQPDESESKFGVIPSPDDDQESTETEDALDPERESEPQQTSRQDPDPRQMEPPEPEPAPPTAPTTPSQHDEEGPYLTRCAGTAATEVLLMEWLTMLVDKSGQEGALKALDHYDRIDWISEPVKRDLEVMLSGAHCTPDTAPRNDLNTDVHDRSFKYIARLSQQAQLEQSAQLG